MGRMVTATEERIGALTSPDVALVALAFTFAAMLDDPDTATAAAGKEYRATMRELTIADQPKGRGLDDIDDMDDD